MNSFWSHLFDWLDRNLAKVLLAFGLGHKIGSDGKAKVEKELEASRYEKEKLQNEIDLRNSADKRDLIHEFIKRNKN